MPLAKNTGKPKKKKVGSRDWCENGCLIVDNIRVPAPTCPVHGGTENVDSGIQV